MFRKIGHIPDVNQKNHLDHKNFKEGLKVIMKTVTLRYAVLTLATISMVAFAADKNLNAKDPFFKYFDSFVASPAEISIKLPR